jgi:hypothetical protein
MGEQDGAEVGGGPAAPLQGSDDLGPVAGTAGSTLTNNQVGVVVAEVLKTKPKVRVTAPAVDEPGGR